MKYKLLVLLLSAMFVISCGTIAPNLEATVQSAISATQTRQVAQTPLVKITSTAVTTPKGTLTQPASPPAKTNQPLIQAPGMVLFLKVTSNKDQKTYDLYSFANNTITLLQADIGYPFLYVSPNKKMAASPNGRTQVQVIQLVAQAGKPRVAYYPLPPGHTGISNLQWSPDSSKIATRNSCSLDVLDLATQKWVNIWKECYPDMSPPNGIKTFSWSPDSTRIAFSSVSPSSYPSAPKAGLHGDFPAKLMVAAVNGAAPIVLDEHGDNPVWSPDSQKIVYTGGWRTDADGDVYCNEKLIVINADGSGKKTLAEEIGAKKDSWAAPYFWYLGWSANSRMIHFLQGAPTEAKQLSVIRTDGTGRINLSERQSTNWVQSWTQAGLLGWLETNPQKEQRYYLSQDDGTGKKLLDIPPITDISKCNQRLVWMSEKEWFASDLEGKNRVPLGSVESAPSSVPVPRFSPDCTQAVIADSPGASKGSSKFDLFDLQTGSRSQVIKANTNEEFYVVSWVQQTTTP